MENDSVLQSIIDNFNVDKFERFFREKCDTLRFPKESIPPQSDISDNFESGIKLAKGELEDKTFIVCSFLAKKSLTERSSKKIQYEIGKRILKLEDADAGIFIFYDSEGKFRFSLIYASYLGRHRDWSSFRRYTYFVSKDQTNKTFLLQMQQADFSSLERLKEAFSVEKVTKAFYAELQNWYFWAMDKVVFPDDEDKDRESRNAKNLIRLITRIIFIWFMKEKKLIPTTLFEKSFVDNILNYNDKEGSTYYKAILQNLFFATLNTPMRRDNSASRIFVEEAQKHGIISDAYLQQGYYRYSRFIKDREQFLKEFDNIPFLNGGLFECLDKKVDGKEIRIDCFSDNLKNESRLKVPDDLFFLENESEVNLSYIGNGTSRKVRGLFPILKSYNFTTDENTPIDEEIALDPELLGKVFENLLASYNPETATTARNATGSYYTPREIVDYMVTESLVQYLKQNMEHNQNQVSNQDSSPCKGEVSRSDGGVSSNQMTSSMEARLRKLFVYDDDITDFNDQEKNTIIEALSNIKILDPACGSGAFPMGILHKLVLALHKLDPDNKIWKKRLLDKIAVEIRAEVEKSLENKSLDYIRKLGLIEHCIFGVDIQEIAIQISKLRFFISLLIEQEVDDSKENRDIRALPNLETKFVAANTLIGLDTGLYLESNEVKTLKNKLFEIREKLFYTNKRTEKYELQKELTSLRKQLKIELEKNGFPNDKAEKITQWDPFDQNTHADFFDPEWMFGVNHGFDIIIGNPPYIQLQKAYNSKIKFADLYKNQDYQTFDRTGDIYCLFYEKGINLLNDKGHLAFITSNKWMRAGYGEKLRKFFLNYNPKILIDLGPNVFESATVDTNILIIQKAKNQNQLFAVKITEKKKDKLDFARLLRENGVILSKLTSDAWFIGDDAEQRLKEKIEQIGKPLKEWDVKIYRGVLTGLNEAFIINNTTRDEILANCKDEAEKERTKAIIKPILRGKDIKRYYYQWAGIWVIFIPWHFPLHEDLSIQGASKEAEEKFIEQYPAVYSHLLKYKDALLKRNKEETGIRYEWYALQRCAATYYHEFEKEKVVWQRITQRPTFCLVSEGIYILDSMAFFVSRRNLKYQMAVLNSSIVLFYVNKIVHQYGFTGFRLSNQYVEIIPLPPITVDNERIVYQIEALVDKILEAKKTENHENLPDTTPYEREIDHLVYKLYNLTDPEIKIIENDYYREEKT